MGDKRTHIELQIYMPLPIKRAVNNAIPDLISAAVACGSKAQAEESAMVLAAVLDSASGRLLYWWTLMRVASMRRQVSALDALKKISKRHDE
jgi:hypothetical protein